MIFCLDAAYSGEMAVGCALCLESVDSSAYEEVYSCTSDSVAPYRPGSFYLRELPVLLKVMRQAALVPSLLIVDGYVYLPGPRPGLGMHLFHAFHEKIPVIGIAKNPFRGHDSCEEVFRGKSRRPLYVTAAGLEDFLAADMVRQMSGRFRIPDMVRACDQYARTLVRKIQEK